MAADTLVLCGGAHLTSRAKQWKAVNPRRLKIGTSKGQVRIRYDHITRRMKSGLDNTASDLIEIASFVYAADQSARRGGTKEFEYGEKWRRNFRFEIPVRLPDLWNSVSVQNALKDLLSFLTDDDYEFCFCSEPRPRPFEKHLFNEIDDESDFEEVMLFSGGLDSFGGAVQEVIQGQRKVVLVSHRPVNNMYSRQVDLVSDLKGKLNDNSLDPLHVAVEVNKDRNLGREFTQRCRSFLFGAIGATVAKSMSLNRIRFYENGVTSVHLPIGYHVVGGRATRTTHPRTLNLMAQLFTEIFGSPFQVENPFQWKTKTEILQSIKAAGCGSMCPRTCSCTRTKDMTLQHTHCGRCSQCVDRRLCAIAAGLTDDEDPPEVYKSSVITGQREGAEFNLIERYVGLARRVDRMGTADELFEDLGEGARALTQFPMRANEAAERIFDLYKRHSRSVCSALATINSNNAALVVSLDYPPNSLLGIAVGRGSDCKLDGAPKDPSARLKSDGSDVVIDRETFSVTQGTARCQLRAGKEFSFLCYLHRKADRYAPLSEIEDEVWPDQIVQKNTIQRTACNLRRKLRDAGITGFTIDGETNDGYYALLKA